MHISQGARHDFLRRYGVPDGWEAHCLGQLARVVGGGTPSREEPRFWVGGTIPWATPTDLTANKTKHISKTAECITQTGLMSSAAELLPTGAILYTSRATIGAKAIATIPMATNQGFASFVADATNGDYLYYLLDLLTPTIKRLAAGTTFDEVSKRDVRNVWCSLPSKQSEQAAIARILTAVDLALERIHTAVERARELKRACLQRFFYDALGETAYADRPKKKPPRGWMLLPTHRLLAEEPKNGLSPESSTQPPGIPTFSIAAIRDGKVDLKCLEHLKYARVGEKVAERYHIRCGDILIVRGNANPNLVGTAGVVDWFPDGCIYPDITVRIAFKGDSVPKVIPAFAVLAWNHALVHNQVLRRAKTSNGTLKINSRDINQIVMPVPPESDQVKICKTVRAVDTWINALSASGLAHEEIKKSLLHDLLTGHVRVPSAAQVEAA